MPPIITQAIIDRWETLTGASSSVCDEVESLTCRIQCLEEEVRNLRSMLEEVLDPVKSMEETIALWEILNCKYNK